MSPDSGSNIRAFLVRWGLEDGKIGSKEDWPRAGSFAKQVAFSFCVCTVSERLLSTFPSPTHLLHPTCHCHHSPPRLTVRTENSPGLQAQSSSSDGLWASGLAQRGHSIPWVLIADQFCPPCSSNPTYFLLSTFLFSNKVTDSSPSLSQTPEMR